MEIAVYEWRCPGCGAKITQRLIVTEGLEPKAEQVQPPVQQPDAALSSDEPPGSAAGNPVGDACFYVRVAKKKVDDYLSVLPEGHSPGLRDILRSVTIYLQGALHEMK